MKELISSVLVVYLFVHIFVRLHILAPLVLVLSLTFLIFSLPLLSANRGALFFGM